MASQSLHSILDDPRVKALKLAHAVDAELYLVGGALRGLLLNTCTPATDLDFASPLPPESLMALFASCGMRVIPTGLRHQTVTVIPIANLPAVEVTSFRAQGMTPEGGVVLGSSIEEDLSFRDFTVNAMALGLNTGRLIDPFQGEADIEKRVLRAVGVAEERFKEDPLRILRLLRLGAELDFSLEPATFSAACGLSESLRKVSIERVRDELSRIILTSAVRSVFIQLHQLGFFAMFLPEVEAFYQFEQNDFHPHDLFFHTIEVMERTEPDLILRLAALFHDVGKPPTLSVSEDGERHFYLHEKIGADMIDEIFRRLRYSGEITAAVKSLVYTHMRPIDAGSGGLRRILRDSGEQYERWRKLKYADTVAVLSETDELKTAFLDFDARMEEVKQGPEVSPLRSLAINGDDLIALGFTPSKLFKEILLELHEKVLDNPELNTRETLLEMVQSRAK